MGKTIKYQKVNKLNNEEFKRVTGGVSKETFALMKDGGGYKGINDRL